MTRRDVRKWKNMKCYKPPNFAKDKKEEKYLDADISGGLPQAPTANSYPALQSKVEVALLVMDLRSDCESSLVPVIYYEEKVAFDCICLEDDAGQDYETKDLITQDF